MKAIVRDRYGYPDVLQCAEVDDPDPGAGEVIVRVHAASLNTADSDHLKGRPFLARIGWGLLRPSGQRMGLDVSGTVQEVSPDVAGLSVGDEVWADLFAHGHGSLAEYVRAPASAFTRIPVNASFEAASAVPHSGVLALQGLRPGGGIRSGDTVLINGAGGCVGPFAVQIAKAFGAEVTAVDHADKLEMLRKLGADHVVDHRAHEVTDATRCYDRVLDVVGNRSVLRWRRVLRPDGVYTLIAATMSGFCQAAIGGGLITAFSSKRLGVFSWRPNVRADLEVLGGLIEQGELTPLIDRRFQLDDAAAAFRYLQSGHTRGKVTVSPA